MQQLWKMSYKHFDRNIQEPELSGDATFYFVKQFTEKKREFHRFQPT